MLDEARRIARTGTSVGEGSKPTPGTGQKVVAAWLKEFDASRARGNQVVLLPYGDPDVAGLLDAGDPLQGAGPATRGAATEGFILAPYPGFTNGLWLEGGAAASRYLAAASTGFPGATADDVNLVSSASWLAAERPSLTPTSPVYDIRTPEGPRDTVRTVVADSALTSGGPDAGHRREPAPGPAAVRGRDRADCRHRQGHALRWSPLPPRGWDSEGRATAALAARPGAAVDQRHQRRPGRGRDAEAADRQGAGRAAVQRDHDQRTSSTPSSSSTQATTTLKDLLADAGGPAREHAAGAAPARRRPAGAGSRTRRGGSPRSSSAR